MNKTSKAYYYLRCGCGLDECHAGVWHHGKCHTAPAILWEDRETTLDVTGGWHDAGDYGKYVTAGACAAAHLLYSFRLFENTFVKQDLNIPETGEPDILSEVRYELEWLLKDLQNGLTSIRSLSGLQILRTAIQVNTVRVMITLIVSGHILRCMRSLVILNHDKILLTLNDEFPLTEFGYSEVGGLGTLAYLLCDRDKDTQLEHRLKCEFLRCCDELKNAADQSGYSVAMNDDDFCWGSNMGVMTKAMLFAINDIIFEDRSCREYAANHLHYLLGANALGISYITGVGDFRCTNPHLRPAFADGIEECIPGMVA